MHTIYIFSAGRSDFGLLCPIIKSLKKKIKANLMVSSQHSDIRFGNTIKEINEKNIKIVYQNREKLKNTKIKNIFSFFSRTSLEYFLFLEKKKPSAILLLGDRYEVFSVAIAAHFLDIPIIHMHGGELTLGAFDDGIRHSISKLSNLHFVVNNNYRKRLINMGENPNSIFNFGSIACEQIKLKKFANNSIFKKRYNLNLTKSILITFHPETKSNIQPQYQIQNLLQALSCFKDYNLVFTASNPDTHGIYFNKEINKFKKKNKNVHIINNMGQDIYWDFLKHSSIVLGNSSSGIIEAPAIKTPTLNIGNRQEGRIYSKSIFHAKIEKVDIINKLRIILKKKKFKFNNNFYKRNTTRNIMYQIIKFLKKNKKNKKFYDIKKLY